MKKTPLNALPELGQSVWLDYIRRNLITSGELKRLVEEDDLRGLTSNPAIFEKAILDSADYRDLLDRGTSSPSDPMALYEQIAVRDIRDAADILRPVYERTGRRDGYVSLEVSPRLADDTHATIAEARRLWQLVARENLMVKVPATPRGIAAIERLVGEGININVTLLFARSVYEQVAAAYVAGLERLAAAGGDPGRVASVASFFVSRIDGAVDALLEAQLRAGGRGSDPGLLRGLLGKAAIANARLTYDRYRELFGGPRWEALAQQGARTQRLLWASTSTKNPAYRDVLYVEELIGPDTVNTLPPATLEAFRDHGRVRLSLTEGLDEARRVMAELERCGISLEQVTDRLLEDGVRLFAEAFDKLLEVVAQRVPAGPPPAARTGRR